jgi:hypothetical protein
MKIADQRHSDLEIRTLKTDVHVSCHCGITFGWPQDNIAAARCPSCHSVENLAPPTTDLYLTG